MKKNILLLAVVSLLFIGYYSKAQVFSSKIVISSNINNPEAVASADLNNDGYNDVVFTTVGDNKLCVSLFDTNIHNFATPQIITNSLNYGLSLDIADIDGDGLKDIITVSVTNNQVLWFKNNNNGNFSQQPAIDNNAAGATYAIAADINNDGNIDVVAALKLDNKILWYQNDGSGNFLQGQIITDNAEIPVVIEAADIDNDNDIDIIAGYGQTDKIVYFINDGSGNFFGPTLITNQTDYISSIKVADINNDGKVDIVSTSKNDNKLAWYKNLGNNIFSQQIIIADSIAQAYNLQIADFDLDNDLDIITTSLGDNKIYLFKNENSNFVPQIIASSHVTNPKWLAAADFNNDGNIDFAAALSDEDPDEVVWFENGKSFFITHNINHNRDINCITLYDLNQDGFLDIFYANSTGVYCVYNNGDNSFGDENTIYENGYNISDLKFADIDNDGDKDLFCSDAMGDQVFWFKNNNGNLSSKITIDNTGDGPISMDFADVDNDNDLDILVSFVNNDEIVIYNNINGQGNFSKNVIIDSIPTIYGSAFTEINGDNNIDIVFTTYNETRYVINNGNGNFSNMTTINNQGYAWNIISNDLNEDNFQDILYMPNYNMQWLENNHDATFTAHDIPFYGDEFCVGDIDNDGDVDIIGADRGWGIVNPIINNDTFALYLPIYITDARVVAIGDINNDGWKDIVVGTWPDEGIYWIENYMFRIINQPIDQFVCQGEKAKFSILTTGIIEYQWQVNTGNGFVNLNDDSIYSGTHKAQLIVNTTPNMFGYQYRCVLHNYLNNQVISDVASLDEFIPYIQCVDNQIRTADTTNNSYTVEGTELDPDTVFNKCNESLTLVNDYNNTPTLAGEVFAVGTYTITWSLIDDNNNIINTCSFVLTVQNQSNIEMQNTDFVIYPNPTTGNLFIKTPLPIEKLSIIDFTGQEFIQVKNKNMINLSELNSGIYLLKIKTTNQTFYSKVMKY